MNTLITRKRSILCALGVVCAGLSLGYAAQAAPPESHSKPATLFVDPHYPKNEPQTPQARAKALHGAAPASTPSAAQVKNPPADGAQTFGQAYDTNNGGNGYVGQQHMTWYSNDGASDEKKSCGQAAVATMLYFRGKTTDRSIRVVRDLYFQWPADGYGGIAGTSWQRIQTMLQARGLHVHIVQGLPAIKQEIANGNPVIVMLDVGKCPEWNFQWGGHWVVAYGYNKSSIFLSNWTNADGHTPWNTFNSAADTWLTHAGGFANYGIVATP